MRLFANAVGRVPFGERLAFQWGVWSIVLFLTLPFGRPALGLGSIMQFPDLTSIEGVVVDSLSGAPLAGVLVGFPDRFPGRETEAKELITEILRKDHSQGSELTREVSYFDVTDAEGRFAIAGHKPTDVSFFHPGYDFKHVSVIECVLRRRGDCGLDVSNVRLAPLR